MLLLMRQAEIRTIEFMGNMTQIRQEPYLIILHGSL